MKNLEPDPIPLLFVEDEEAHIDLIQYAFDEYPGVFEITIARTIEEAKFFVKEKNFALIIADYLLPDGKGLDLLSPDSNTQNIPVIIMTSHGNESLAVEVMKKHALDYFIKSDTVFKDMPHLVTRALQYNKNILARKIAEVKIQSTVALLESIMETVPDLLLVVDTDYRVLYSNDKAHMNNPHQQNEPRNAGLYRFKEMKSSSVQCPVREVFQTGKSYEMEATDPLDGKTREFRAFPIRDAAGKINRVVVHVRDISEWKAAVRAISESEEKYRQLVENISDVLFSLDSNGIFTYISPVAHHILGIPVQSIIGNSIFTYIQSEEISRVQDALLEGIAGNEIEIEVQLVLKSGASQFINLSAKPEWNNGVVTGLTGIFSDISDRKNLDLVKVRALKRIEENLILLATLNDQIRNPLTVILCAAEMIDTIEGDTIRSQVKIIDKLINKLDNGWVESDKVRNYLMKYYGVGR
ncbi:MAG TPA: PAS domain S-box protein [Methanospirillum sp.]|nr:PAS domain S-box protein [Methanospirillum sp.]